MGTFLAVSSVIGRTKSEVVNSLTSYAESVGGGLKLGDNSFPNKENGCIIQEENGNTSIYFADAYQEWNDCSEFISKELKAPVFYFQIHDGDFWMYVLFHNGQVVDRFNPVPDYWGDDLSEAELNNWKGDAAKVSSIIPDITASDIDQYLVRWDLDEEKPAKAYPTDGFAREDWQLMDFMTKLKLPYPVDDHGKLKGETYNIWTNQEKSTTQKYGNIEHEKISQKPWWKFW